jgi:clan AA aspartic protease (TIGR02281 family)
MNNRQKALEYLEKSLELGYRRFAHIDKDDDMAPLRGMVEFKALIKKYNKQEKNEGGKVALGSSNVSDNSENVSEIPFAKEDGICKVKCMINELPLHFVFDTGASDVTISMVEATFMMKNGYLSGNDVVGSQRYIDANGDVSVGTIINLKNVNFGGLDLNNVRASVVRNQKAPLLLGQSVLGRLGKIEIDNSKNVLKITHNK